MLDHYRCMQWFISQTHGIRISGLFDLLPQHYLLPEFTPDQHAHEVCDELIDSIQEMNPRSKSKLLNKMATTLSNIITNTHAPSNQRVDTTPTSEGEQPEQWMATAPLVTTSTNPMNKHNLQAKKHIHSCHTQNNSPDTVLQIASNRPMQQQSPWLNQQSIEQFTAITPNVTRITLSTPNIITQEAVNFITDQVYYKEYTTLWTPQSFIMTSSSPPSRATSPHPAGAAGTASSPSSCPRQNASHRGGQLP